ncbi:hypothetical protein [Rariglobus hedericola]|uniref:SGNH/GDSL hydrolase family protein n=1 Tax=Rariglobus hedericola TaxID=2597822 RepID=A0A556QNU2_9BACT|nr:hypothetical protein [Rariglobus hedericola]TSJ78320.1 hypothetical protein FPL22_03160 [Rariglobus hedericola]
MDAATLAEINSLESALNGCKRHPLPPDLEARRHALLARHLGYEPRRPLPIVYVIGDSHSAFFAGAESCRFKKGRGIFTGFFRRRYVGAFTELLPVFRVFHVGPGTAWKADDHGSSTRSREKIDALIRHDIPKGATILVAFGEIDCRCHIPRAVLAGQSIEQAVDATLARFMRLVDRLSSLGFRMAVWGPPAVGLLKEGKPDEPFPATGTYELRLQVTHAYCEALARACAQRHVPCVCLAGTYHDWNERPDRRNFLDNAHVSQNLMPLALRLLTAANVLNLPASTSR